MTTSYKMDGAGMLEEKISKDYIQAMKNKDALRSSTINFLRAQIKNVCIEKKAEKVDDVDVLAVIKKQVKQRQDSIVQFQKGGRGDLVAKEQAELDILKGYLPEEMSPEVLKVIVQEVMQEEQAASMKDMGRVMKAVLDKAQGAADNRLVSTLVKEALGQL